jgi:hypothetical protein
VVYGKLDWRVAGSAVPLADLGKARKAQKLAERRERNVTNACQKPGAR